jgi:hypothetical protein
MIPLNHIVSASDYFLLMCFSKQVPHLITHKKSFRDEDANITEINKLFGEDIWGIVLGYYEAAGRDTGITSIVYNTGFTRIFQYLQYWYRYW